MFTIDFNTPIHVHFIGIGGISMSGLAKILLDRHFTVSGSDAHISDLTTELQQDGCIISYPQSADNITGDIDLVVYTAAIHPDNPELKAAVDAGIPTLTRAELLGQIMKNYHTAVNVAGTHGKTTTTSMITEILLAADADPTISVGGILNSIGGNMDVLTFSLQKPANTLTASYHLTLLSILYLMSKLTTLISSKTLMIYVIRSSFLLKSFHLTEHLSSTQT